MNTHTNFIALWLISLFMAVAAVSLAQPAPAPEAEEEATTTTRSMMDTISDVFGESGALLETSDKGEIIQSTNDAGEVVSVIARDEVVLRSDKLNLESDYLQIDAIGQKVIATGNVYLVIQGKTAICGRFEYDIASKRSILRESPRIISDEEGENSSNVDVTSCEIIIEEDAAGRTKTLFRACDDKKNILKIGGKKDEAASTKKPDGGAAPINPNDSSDVERIIGGGETQTPTGAPITIPAP